MSDKLPDEILDQRVVAPGFPRIRDLVHGEALGAIRREPTPRQRLVAAANRVTEAMELWVDAVVDYRTAQPEQRPTLEEVNRLENQLASAYSGFTGEVARMLIGMT